MLINKFKHNIIFIFYPNMTGYLIQLRYIYIKGNEYKTDSIYITNREYYLLFLKWKERYPDWDHDDKPELKSVIQTKYNITDKDDINITINYIHYNRKKNKNEKIKINLLK